MKLRTATIRYMKSREGIILQFLSKKSNRRSNLEILKLCLRLGGRGIYVNDCNIVIFLRQSEYLRSQLSKAAQRRQNLTENIFKRISIQRKHYNMKSKSTA